jgi:hypothetical protein
MRCKCCNERLSDIEAVRKDPETKEYLDTCTVCSAMSNPFTIDKIEEEINVLKTLDKQ